MQDYLIFSDNNIIPLNYNFLLNAYKHGNLKDADIFSELFKLKESSFKKEEMFTDENGYITICKFLNINSHEWNIFLNFIKFNHLDNKNNIEVLLYLSNKFGNIPSIDEYKIKMINKKEIYNPMSNQEDFKQLYDWKVYYFMDDDITYNFCKMVEPKSLYGIYRKLKKAT